MKYLIAASMLLAACENSEEIAKKDTKIAELQSQVESLTYDKNAQVGKVKQLQVEIRSAWEYCEKKEEGIVKDYKAKIKVLTEPIEKRHDKCDIECQQKYVKCLGNGTEGFMCDARWEDCGKRCDAIRELDKHNLPFRCVIQ